MTYGEIKRHIVTLMRADKIIEVEQFVAKAIADGRQMDAVCGLHEAQLNAANLRHCGRISRVHDEYDVAFDIRARRTLLSTQRTMWKKFGRRRRWMSAEARLLLLRNHHADPGAS